MSLMHLCDARSHFALQGAKERDCNPRNHYLTGPQVSHFYLGIQ